MDAAAAVLTAKSRQKMVMLCGSRTYSASSASRRDPELQCA